MHEHYLTKALHLAKIRRGFCAPNPAVGAAIVKDNHILGSGYHYAGGHPHAEAEALKNVDEQAARGATLYVTLEPCCHTGKTPPCTDLLIRRGIKRVVFGMRDLNPEVANKSEFILQAAGIETVYLPLPEIQQFYASYRFWWQEKRPYITAKLAMSLDGKIAGAHGERIYLTGAAAQQFTHEQRRQSDAILTTAKTIIADDPLLNVRLANETCRKPVYIIDSRLETPLNANVFLSAEKVILFHHSQADAEKITAYSNKNAQCVKVSANKNGLNLLEIVNYIGGNGAHDVWLEAGGRCFAAFLQENLIQHAFIYIAPQWLGAAAQTAFTAQHNIFKHVKRLQWTTLGADGVCEMFFNE